MSMAEEPLSPDDAYDRALGVLGDWGAYAEAMNGDGVSDPDTQLANATGRLVAVVVRQLAGHRPVWEHGSWVCPSCVEIAAIGGIARATAPCRFFQDILGEILGPDAVAGPSTSWLQMMTQDGPEPYVGEAAQELERMLGVSSQQARESASLVVRFLSRRPHLQRR